jgi:hypothetical protein
MSSWRSIQDDVADFDAPVLGGNLPELPPVSRRAFPWIAMVTDEGNLSNIQVCPRPLTASWRR